MDKCAENIPQKAKWDIPKYKKGYPKVQKGIPQKVFWDIKELGNKRIFIRRTEKMEGRLGSLHFCKFANAKNERVEGYTLLNY